MLYKAVIRILYDDILLNYLEMYTFRLNEEDNSKNGFTLYLVKKITLLKYLLKRIKKTLLIIC